MNLDRFEQPEENNDASYICSLLNSRILMVLAVLGASFVYGCTPKPAKMPKSISSSTFNKCAKCLNGLMEQKLNDYDCLNQEVDLIKGTFKPPRKVCKLRHSRSVYSINRCNDACKDLKDKGEKCTFKVTKFRLKVLDRIMQKLSCFIEEHQKKKRGAKYSFKKCKVEPVKTPSALINECSK